MSSTLLNVNDKLKLKARQAEIVSSFIKKTYEMLEEQRFTDIVDWNAEGTALVIKKPVEFGQKVLPTYFKHNNLTSFVRQLNMYDFHKRRTQKYDHVYYHDLFQKDKKHLLKEIKRKNQDTTLVTIQKAIECLENAQSGQKVAQDATSMYENQLLKKLNKDALSRIASLESKVKDLTIQNQALWNQITTQNQKEDLLVSFLANFMKTKGITLDQLPNVLSNQFNLPHIDMQPNKTQVKEECLDRHYAQKQKLVNVGDFFNFGTEDSCNSTELSPSSPLSKDASESEKLFNYNDLSANSLDNYPEIKTKLQNSMAGVNNDNFMLNESNNNRDWNLESSFLNSLADADNKAGRSGDTVLGKRQLDRADSLNLIDKLVKKDSYFEPRDFENVHLGDNMHVKEEMDGMNGMNGMKIRKLESFGDIFAGLDQMPNHIDLMDFNRF